MPDRPFSRLMQSGHARACPNGLEQRRRGNPFLNCLPGGRTADHLHHCAGFAPPVTRWIWAGRGRHAHALTGREKEVRDQTSEASADRSDFPPRAGVSTPLAGKNLHLVFSPFGESQSLFLQIFNCQTGIYLNKIIQTCQAWMVEIVPQVVGHSSQTFVGQGRGPVWVQLSPRFCDICN
jgi:hypothetical protein